MIAVWLPDKASVIELLKGENDSGRNRRASKGRGWVPATQDMMQIAQSASGAHTYCYRRGPGGLTPDFLTLSGYTLCDIIEGLEADLLVVKAEPDGSLPKHVDWLYQLIPIRLLLVRGD